MKLCVISRATLFFVRGILHLCREYSHHILSLVDKVRIKRTLLCMLGMKVKKWNLFYPNFVMALLEKRAKKKKKTHSKVNFLYALTMLTRALDPNQEYRKYVDNIPNRRSSLSFSSCFFYFIRLSCDTYVSIHTLYTKI